GHGVGVLVARDGARLASHHAEEARAYAILALNDAVANLALVEHLLAVRRVARGESKSPCEAEGEDNDKNEHPKRDHQQSSVIQSSPSGKLPNLFQQFVQIVKARRAIASLGRARPVCELRQANQALRSRYVGR